MQSVKPIRLQNDINRVKTMFRKERDFILFVLGINCGLRISDLLKLKVVDVKNKSHIDILEQKTGKTKRIPITPVLESLLNSYTKYKNADQWLFAS